MDKKTFILEKIMTVSPTIWFICWGLIVAIGYFGIKVWWGNHTLSAFSMAMGVISVSLYLVVKFNTKEKVVIEVIDKKDINIYFDEKMKISAPISDLKKIFTIHYVNTKADVQTEIVFKDGAIDLYGVGNYVNKEAFDDFIRYLEKEFKFTYKKAPMSLRWSKHYVEYTNPLYNE